MTQNDANLPDNIVRCPNCESLVSSRFPRCPGCRTPLSLRPDQPPPIERTENPKARPLIFLVIIALIVACACTIIVTSFGLFEPVYLAMQEAGLLPTGAPIVTSIPTPTRDLLLTPTGPSTPTPEPVVMYVCGYDRCRDSGEYGVLVRTTGIEVWNNPDPERGGVHHTVDHHDQVSATRTRRVSDGPGGLWFALGGEGWIDDLWVTEQPCVPANLEQYSFANCQSGEY